MTGMSHVPLQVPSAFPRHAYDAVAQLLDQKYQSGLSQSDREKCGDAIAAWDGVLYRYVSCVDQAEAFIRLWRQITNEVQTFFNTPQANLSDPASVAAFGQRVQDYIHNLRQGQSKYEQERELFGFFVNGLSSLECAAYAVFAVGSLCDAAAFPMTTDAEKRSIGVRSAASRLMQWQQSQGMVVTAELDALSGDWNKDQTTLGKWKETRNTLVHKASPPLTLDLTLNRVTPQIFTPIDHARGHGLHIAYVTKWEHFTLDDTTVGDLRQWLSDTIGRLIPAIETFARATL